MTVEEENKLLKQHITIAVNYFVDSFQKTGIKIDEIANVFSQRDHFKILTFITSNFSKIKKTFDNDDGPNFEKQVLPSILYLKSVADANKPKKIEISGKVKLKRKSGINES